MYYIEHIIIGLLVCIAFAVTAAQVCQPEQRNRCERPVMSNRPAYYTAGFV